MYIRIVNMLFNFFIHFAIKRSSVFKIEDNTKYTQCEKLRIFLSLGFYVKSILACWKGYKDCYSWNHDNFSGLYLISRKIFWNWRKQLFNFQTVTVWKFQHFSITEFTWYQFWRMKKFKKCYFCQFGGS